MTEKKKQRQQQQQKQKKNCKLKSLDIFPEAENPQNLTLLCFQGSGVVLKGKMKL